MILDDYRGAQGRHWIASVAKWVLSLFVLIPVAFALMPVAFILGYSLEAINYFFKWLDRFINN